MLLNEDLFLLTGKRELKLSEPQKTMIRLAQEMELPVGKGVLIFIQGPYGSGKTVLAIEIARIIAARREQQLEETPVQSHRPGGQRRGQAGDIGAAWEIIGES